MISVSETQDIEGFFERISDCIPISELLADMDFSEIEWTLHKHLNYAQGRKWKYPPILLLKILTVKLFRDLSYNRTIHSLTHEDCEYLGIQESKLGIFSIPSSSTLHDFAYNRLGIDGIKMIMHKIGSIACKYIRNGTGMIDSTPIEVSKYDKYTQYRGCFHNS